MPALLTSAVDAAERGERRGERGVDLALAGDVAAHGQRAWRPLATIARRAAPPRCVVDVPERDRAPSAANSRAQAAPMPLAGAGDDDDAAGEVEADVVHDFAPAAPVQPDRDALRVELEVEREQFARCARRRA